ncbi:MAG: YhcH/YjgK/YiaL family protein [Dysgonamonadaceae bacterium]|jgi:YhcH/YjgK/YiaL family protein|nr:YhcH/YjgK/YiaL family protein [Dysgonamonadaceae bacterium]
MPQIIETLSFKQGSIKVVANESIDKKEWETHYEKFPERWSVAFKFLNDNDLSALPTGRYELDGKNVYVNVMEYETRSISESPMEAHREYIDIQYIISGEENIGLTKLQNTINPTEYDDVKDILFMEPEKPETFHKADGKTFFVFFPDDAHRPYLTISEKTAIKKAVVKLKYN